MNLFERQTLIKQIDDRMEGIASAVAEANEGYQVCYHNHYAQPQFSIWGYGVDDLSKGFILSEFEGLDFSVHVSVPADLEEEMVRKLRSLAIEEF